MRTFQVRVGDGEATCVWTPDQGALPDALAGAGLSGPRPVLVLVGGAGGLDAASLKRLATVFGDALVPAIEEQQALAVDGGTDSGVMRLLGEARAAAAASFQLVGVAAAGTVRVTGPGLPELPSPRDDAAALEPHHTHFVLVPGDQWGVEASWIASTASHLAGSAPSVTVLVNGGDIAYEDARHSLDAGRPVVVVDGSGRAADQIAAAVRGEPSDPRAHQVADSGLVSYVDSADAGAVRDALTAALGRPSG